MFADPKFACFLHACATKGWPTEPGDASTRESPLHDTLFSINAFSNNAWFLSFQDPLACTDPVAYQIEVDKAVERKSRALTQLYSTEYRSCWREYAAWCDDNAYHYALDSAQKLVDFLEYGMEVRRQKDPSFCALSRA